MIGHGEFVRTCAVETSYVVFVSFLTHPAGEVYIQYMYMYAPVLRLIAYIAG